MAVMVPNTPIVPTPPVPTPGGLVLTQRLLRVFAPGPGFVELPHQADYDSVSANHIEGLNTDTVVTACEYRPSRSKDQNTKKPSQSFTLKMVCGGRTRDEALGQVNYWSRLLVSAQYLWEGQLYYLALIRAASIKTEPQRGGLSHHLDITWDVDGTRSSWYLPMAI